MVGDAPLDPAKTYTVSSHNYLLRNGGDGYTMFMDNPLLQDSVMIDNQVLINYIVDVLGGTVGDAYADPYGDGRVTGFGKPGASLRAFFMPRGRNCMREFCKKVQTNGKRYAIIMLFK